ncbi:MAG: hypothetical protein QOI36_4810, partial [Pseudonocardiales bacterium]|nr:hypothetical protein [Pseudonocardiales bacterium]
TAGLGRRVGGRCRGGTGCREENREEEHQQGGTGTYPALAVNQ